MPFVKKRDGKWFYHDVVRSQLLRYKRQESPSSWAELHKALASDYQACYSSLGLERQHAKKNEIWQTYWLEEHYHQIAEHLANPVPFALGVFLEA